MYTTLAVSTEDIFFIAKAEDDYLSANALNTLWNKYGLSINSATVAEYSPNDIRLALLGGTWTGGKCVVSQPIIRFLIYQFSDCLKCI